MGLVITQMVISTVCARKGLKEMASIVTVSWLVIIAEVLFHRTHHNNYNTEAREMLYCALAED